MNSQQKVLIVIAMVMLGLAVFFSEVESQTTQPDLTQLCNSRNKTNITAWDNCKNKPQPWDGSKKYASCSQCYLANNQTMQYVYRYDYFTCMAFPGNPGVPIISCFNCSVTPTTYTNNYTDVYNYFNQGSQQCNNPAIAQNSTVPPPTCT